MRSTTLWILLILLALPLACSQAEDKAEEAASAAAEVADAAAASAQEATDAAAEKASAMASEAKETAAAAAAAELKGDPVAKCSELAAKGAWSEALDVCKKAHEAAPDNMAIEHALQQAQAAAE